MPVPPYIKEHLHDNERYQTIYSRHEGSIAGLITNFHLPGSTLLMLVSAYAGKGTIMNAYQEAIDTGYRFYSFGDAMFLLNDNEDKHV